MLQDMPWRRLFLEHRRDWNHSIGFHAISHAVFEVGLRFHSGWREKALAFHVPTAFFTWNERYYRAYLDATLAGRLDTERFMQTPRTLRRL